MFRRFKIAVTVGEKSDSYRFTIRCRHVLQSHEYSRGPLSLHSVKSGEERLPGCNVKHSAGDYSINFSKIPGKFIIEDEIITY